MATSFLPFISVLLILFFHPLTSTANIQTAKNLLKTHLLDEPTTTIAALDDTTPPPPPTPYFEVTKPINVPKTKPCTHHILQHDFGFTYGKPPVVANYTPPSHCSSRRFSKIVLEWKATCKGRQFDRIFGVWLGGVELLRSCTAEPKKTGIVWNVTKDITRYSSLLMKKETQELAVYVGNIVDSTYTGVYHVNVTLYFYPSKGKLSYPDHGPNIFASGANSKADLILPISRNLPLNDGLWFEIQNFTDAKAKEFKIPQNAYRALLEVYVSFHENDEFWYTNPPDDYINANNLTDNPGNGPFREVVISLDGNVVGAIWPFTVIFTGGFNPLLWRPVSAIGSFNLPSYDIELTPFLGSLLDGKTHNLEFSVTNALNVWYVNANLHLWLDRRSKKTEGKLLEHEHEPPFRFLASNFAGLDGTFFTRAGRVIRSKGWVQSSHGNITTHANQFFAYNNSMEFRRNGQSQIVDQLIRFDDIVYFIKPSSPDLYLKSLKTFHFHSIWDEIDQGSGISSYTANVTLGFDETTLDKDGYEQAAASSLENIQNAQGVMELKNNLVQNGQGSNRQTYKYVDGDFCYSRNLLGWNYTLLYDHVKNSCK